MSYFVLFALLLGTTSFADDVPGFGANIGNQSSAAIIGNYNLFNWDKQNYGFYRYGGGGGRLQIGQGLGLSLSSTGGIMAHQTKHSVLGVEVLDGTIVCNTNRSVESQYTFLPGVSLLGRLGPFMLGPKIGGYVGNLGTQGMTPHIDLAYGGQALYKLGTFSGEGVYTRTLGGLLLLSAEITALTFVARYERYEGLRQENNYILMLKVGNF